MTNFVQKWIPTIALVVLFAAVAHFHLMPPRVRAVIAAPGVTPEQIEDFDAAWTTFYRHYAGCPSEADRLCMPARAYFDKKAWDRARSRARKMFDLEERNEHDK